MIPINTFKKPLSEPLPSSHVHMFSTPPMMEALNLLPLAYRVGSHIAAEKKLGRGTIFDLNGLTLQPPHPGPFGGCPLGGMGSGSIGRGFRGDFRRWSLNPGKYIHKVVEADQFSIRIKKGAEIYSAVLTPFDCDKQSGLSDWGWGKIGWSSISYEATFPRAWTVFNDPLPHIRVVMKQVSPFLPHSYSETSFPVGVFHLEVENLCDDDIEVSVMFTFQNGYSTAEDEAKKKIHAQFQKSYLSSNLTDTGLHFPTGYPAQTEQAAVQATTEQTSEEPLNSSNLQLDSDIQILGVCMSNQDVVQAEKSSRSSFRGRNSGKSSPVKQPAEHVNACSAITDCFPGLEGSRSSSSQSDEEFRLASNNLTFAIATCCERAAQPSRHEAISGNGSGDQPPKDMISAGDGIVSSCTSFLVNTYHKNWFGQTMPTNSSSGSSSSSTSYSKRINSGEPVNATELWQRFHLTGDLFLTQDQSLVGSGFQSASHLHSVANEFNDVGAAVCLRKTIPGRSSSTYSFSLAWDIPQTQFGPESAPLPKYYTKFFGRNKLSAHSIATLALLRSDEWERRICEWQQEILSQNSKVNKEINMHVPRPRHFRSPSAPPLPVPAINRTLSTLDSSVSVSVSSANGDTTAISSSASVTEASSSNNGSGTSGGEPIGPDSVEIPEYYNHLVFNELYFLVDGGTIWTDSANGVANEPPEANVLDAVAMMAAEADEAEDDSFMGTSRESLVSRDSIGGSSDGSSLYNYINHKSKGLGIAFLKQLVDRCLKHDKHLQEGSGEQKDVGQFLYLEGHEYLMYNTYDVHFYASFALLQLFPQVELSIQLDFANAVSREDKSTRKMLANGLSKPRKVKGAVPHDLGSPFEQPWTRLNAYNLQDVSRWKDLGPKFVLQVYRDFQYLCMTQSTKSRKVDVQFPSSCVDMREHPELSKIDDAISFFESIELSQSAENFLAAVFPAVISTMERTAEYDKDGDGMIENEAYPDQTYDIWTAEGVHAYCGGLWIAANEAAAQMSVIMGVFDRAESFKLTASRARVVYIDKLWNGKYFNYDSSSSSNSDSIMADMLAGHWYARLCGLPGVVPANMALSCYETIYQYNVIKFGNGELIGAVNGMKLDGSIDNSCMQSREVWTGTTYALAAGMLHESLHVASSTTSMIQERLQGSVNSSSSSGSNSNSSNTCCLEASAGADLTCASESAIVGERCARLSSESEAGLINRCRLSRKLWQNAFATAQGIHDGGWKKFGYWFATPEAWEQNGNYRSLGYMRPLSIWAMQFSLTRWLDTTEKSSSQF